MPFARDRHQLASIAVRSCQTAHIFLSTTSIPFSKDASGVFFSHWLIEQHGASQLLQVLSWPALYLRTNNSNDWFHFDAHLCLRPLSTVSRTWNQAEDGVAVLGGNYNVERIR